jgi:protein-S-isoprenylcysteine O-methyltransferase Ste14
VALVAAGLAFSAWARRHLGRNWSGVISLKAGHDLVRSGPYRLARHPIYAGLLLAMLGSAGAWGDWRGLLAYALALIAILPRISAEDALMARTFGDRYRDCRQNTAAIIPFLI